MPSCAQCSESFITTDEDLKFLTKMHVPSPSLCPECRMQRRMAFRNEKTLYKRKCDLCGKSTVSLYSPEKPFPVYCTECFWSDGWDPLEYGREFDFSRPFFPQFSELLQKVPRLGIVNKQCENSDYCNYSFANKNCYLTFGNHYEEECLYGRYSTKNKNCMDYLYLYESELSYECLFSKNLYECVFLDHSEECGNCHFSVDLKGCKHCLFSANLRHKEYYIFNKEYSRDEYLEKLKEYGLNTHKGFETARSYFIHEFRTQFPFRAVYQTNTQNSTGSNLENCKNLRSVFDSSKCEDIAYTVQADETYDSMDMTCMGYDRSELCYETIGCSGLFNSVSCDSCWHNSNLLYSNLCFTCDSLFGCISLRHKKYCVLNREYSKEEYEKKRKEIISHMEKTGEWGGFFPSDISPYAYNETIAQEYFPLEKEEILKKRWKWRDEDKPDFSGVTKRISAKRLPETIGKIPDDILNWAIECEKSGKPFKVQKKELEFYRTMDLPVPHFHPDVRMEMRLALRSPRKLWDRDCAKCGKSTPATFSPERPETVYCEECYLNSVY